MKINIEHSVDHYRADCKELPGSPPVGVGETPEMAVACLFWRLLFENTGGPNNRKWVDLLEQHEQIVVNGKVWDWPESYKRDMR